MIELKEGDKDSHGRPHSPARAFFKEWASQAFPRSKVSRGRKPPFEYCTPVVRAAWKGYSSRILYEAQGLNLKRTLALAVLMGDQVAENMLVDLITQGE